MSIPFPSSILLARVGAGAVVSGLLLLGSLLWPVSENLLTDAAVVSTRVTDRNGHLLREMTGEGRGRPVALDEVHPATIAALVAVEDRAFFHHSGVDFRALGRAFWTNLRNRSIVSGGSTLTMQVARTLRGRIRRGWGDKLAEMHLAIRIERQLTKKQILSLWLNRVNFGNEAYGIEAASRLYFGKSAADLTIPESAYLVGLPQSPSRLNPFRHPERALNRQKRVLQAMEETHRLSAVDRAHLESMPISLMRPQSVFRAPHLVRYLTGSAGTPAPEVRTTLDLHLQTAVEEMMRGHIYRLYGHEATNAAAVVLDNRTGDVLAYVGSVDFWNERNGGQNDGIRMLRQPGSALKPFTYAYALASGRYTPASVLPDIALNVPEAGGAFSPENYDRREHGPAPLRTALACSYNIPAVRIGREIGTPALLNAYRQAGLTSLKGSPEFYGAGLTLGNGEVRLIELARAYAGLARGGTLPRIRFEGYRITADRDTLYQSVAPGISNGISPEIAYLITDILSDPAAREPAFGRGGPLELPFPCAVKTGTSKDYRDNWAVGYTPRHTVAVWAGNFDGRPMQWVSGVSGAGPLLKSIFLMLGSGGDFPQPVGIVTAVVCPLSGMRPGAYCPTSQGEIFAAGTVPSRTCNVHRPFRIDTRTGYLADRSTPSQAVEVRVYAVLPPEYQAWMHEQHWPLPPRITSTDVQRSERSPVFSDAIRVRYPGAGAHFQLDPVLRPEYQRIRLDAVTSAKLDRLTWWVDGKPLAGGREPVYWSLAEGVHSIEARAVDEAGRTLRSRPSVIRVSAYRR